VALGLLLPVVGLGMATLLWGADDPGDSPAAGAAAEATAPAADAGPADLPARHSAPRSRPNVLLIATHGALATLTVLLALLGAIAAVTAR
jgi:hypothetical protein